MASERRLVARVLACGKKGVGRGSDWQRTDGWDKGAYPRGKGQSRMDLSSSRQPCRAVNNESVDCLLMLGRRCKQRGHKTDQVRYLRPGRLRK